MFETIQTMLQKKKKPAFIIVSHQKLLEKFTSEGDKGLERYVNATNLVIDDIISEKTSKLFGNDWSLNEFILKRYDAWQNRGCLTHYTTNLSIEQFFTNFDDRCGDRMIQMTQFVEFSFSDLSYRKRTAGMIQQEKKPVEQETPEWVKQRAHREFCIAVEEQFKPRWLKGEEYAVHRSFYELIYKSFAHEVEIEFEHDSILISEEKAKEGGNIFGSFAQEERPSDEVYLRRAKGFRIFDKLCKQNFNFKEHG